MQTKVLNPEEDNKKYLHIPPILPRPLQQHSALSSGIRRCLKLLGKETK